MPASTGGPYSCPPVLGLLVAMQRDSGREWFNPFLSIRHWLY